MTDKPANSSLNALRSGAYARVALLPWESAEDFGKLKAAIFDDYGPQGPIEESIVLSIVENRWSLERLRQTTAISNQRHDFGRALENSGAKTWREVLTVVRKRNRQIYGKLDAIETSIGRTAAGAQHLELSTDADELEKLAQKIAETCDKEVEILAALKVALDEEEEFFAAYSPKRLEQLVRLENSLDAQLMKLHARFEIVREARILREKLRGQEPVRKPAVVHNNVGETGSTAPVNDKNNDGLENLDLAELDRDDEDDAEEENVFDDDGSASKNRRLSDDDAGENHAVDQDEWDEAGEPDDNDTDEWGEPKKP